MTDRRVMDINPGIRELVSRLNAAGFKTVDSGDGETHDFECDRSYGYVVVLAPPTSLARTAEEIRKPASTRMTPLVRSVTHWDPTTEI